MKYTLNLFIISDILSTACIFLEETITTFAEVTARIFLQRKLARMTRRTLVTQTVFKTIQLFIRPQKFAVVLWYDAVVVVVGVGVVGVCRQVGFRMITFVIVNQSF